MNLKSIFSFHSRLSSTNATQRFKLLISVISVISLGITLTSCNLIGTALGLGLAKLQFGCIPQGVLIDTPSGPVAIENLKSGDLIVGFEGKPVEITQIHQYREDPATSRYLTIHFANGAKITASPRHRIAGVAAVDLNLGDTCALQIVSRIETVHSVSRSFDLLTEDSGYCIEGIPVNSMIGEMRGSIPAQVVLMKHRTERNRDLGNGE